MSEQQPIPPLPIQKYLRDDTLIRAFSVELLDENIWEVGIFLSSCGVSSMCTVSCALSAVNVIEAIPHETLQLLQTVINDHSEAVLLRVDFCEYGTIGLSPKADMLTVLRGDVLYVPKKQVMSTTKEWASLQETLLRLNLAYVNRPSPFRWPALHRLALQLQDHDCYSLFHEEAECVVLDVARGDTFVVQWDEAYQAARRQRQMDPYPPILVLRMTPSEHHKDENVALTRSGFAALVWSRRYIGQRLRVIIHSVCPSERELACNTYATTLDHLGVVEGIAMDAQHNDISSQMLQRQLVTLRDIPFPYFKLFLSIYQEVLQCVWENSEMNHRYEIICENEEQLREWKRELGVFIKLHGSQLDRLLKFLGPEWWKSYVISRSTENENSIPDAEKVAVPVHGMTRNLMFKYLFCGNYKTAFDTKYLFLFRPLRSIMPAYKFSQLGMVCRGSVRQTLFHEQIPDSRGVRHNYIQMDVEMWLSSKEWSQCASKANVHESSYILWTPDREDEKFRKEIQVVVQYFGVEKVTLKVQSKVYPFGVFDRATHKMDHLEPSNEPSRHVFPMVKAEEDSILVCDAVIEFPSAAKTEQETDENKADTADAEDQNQTIHQQVFYYLSKREMSELDDDGEGAGDLKVENPLQKVVNEDEQEYDEEANEKTAGAGLQSEKDEEMRSFISVVPFFFRVMGTKEDVCERLKHIQTYLSQVLCLPIELAYVNGILGYAGSLYLYGRDAFQRSHTRFDSVISIEELNGVKDRSIFSCLESLMESDKEMVRLRDMGEERLARMIVNGSSNGIMLDDPPLVKICTRSREILWADSQSADYRIPEMSQEVFPKALRLTSLSVMSRHLTAENHDKAITCVESKTHSYPSHPDFCLWTDVQVPVLPIAIQGHLHQLPHALRNTERYLCAHLMNSMDQIDRNDGNDDEERIYAAESPLSTFMALLMHLRFFAMRHLVSYDRVVVDSLQKVFAGISTSVRKLDRIKPVCGTRVVLYRLPTAANNGKARAKKTLFLGSRDSTKSDFMELPSESNAATDLAFMHASLVRRMVPTIAFEALAQAPPRGECTANGKNDLHTRPMRLEQDDHVFPISPASHGERIIPGHAELHYLRRNQSLPVLYHPLPWLHVLGKPLMRREELIDGSSDDDEEGEHFKRDDSKNHRAKVQEHIFPISYRLPFMKAKHPYKAQAFGELSKKVIRIEEERRWRRLQTFRDWCGLVLNRSHPFCVEKEAQGARVYKATGKLYFDGTATQAVDVHFATKRQLRVPECMPPRGDTEGRGEEEQEEEELKGLAEPIRDILKMIDERYKESPNTRFALTIESMQPLSGTAFMTIKVYAVDEKEGSRELSYDAMQEEWMVYREAFMPENDAPTTNDNEKGFNNPHRPFSSLVMTEENTPDVIHVRYSVEEEKFLYEWQEGKDD